MAKYTADVTVQITVTFEDDGRHSLVDQASGAVWEHDFSSFTDDTEVHQQTIKVIEQ